MEIASFKFKTKTRMFAKYKHASTLKMVTSVNFTETVACQLENLLKIKPVRLLLQIFNKVNRRVQKMLKWMTGKSVRLYRSQLLLIYPNL